LAARTARERYDSMVSADKVGTITESSMGMNPGLSTA
jgi:hypothetical protein